MRRRVESVERRPGQSRHRNWSRILKNAVRFTEIIGYRLHKRCK